MSEERPLLGRADGPGVGGHGWDDEALLRVSPLQEAARDAADSIRALLAVLESSAATTEELHAAARGIDRVREGLPPAAPGAPARASDPPAVAHAHRLRERSPFIGRANPVALPLVMTFGAEGVEAWPTFDSRYEGPPGCLHGGYIAGIFDEALGAAQAFSGQTGMTGRLTVHYRTPTPLFEQLHLRARLESVSGRKIVCKGTLHAGDRLCAEADGLFIAVDPLTMLADAERRAAERDGA